MKMELSDLEFLISAREMFKAHPDMWFWRGRGNLDSIIAIRSGPNRENIEVFRLDKVVEVKEAL